MSRIGFLYSTYNSFFGDFCHSFLRQVELEDYLFAPDNIVVEFFVRQSIGLIPKNNNHAMLKVDARNNLHNMLVILTSKTLLA